MKIQEFCDMQKFEEIMKNWANATDLATVAVVAEEVQKLAQGMSSTSVNIDKALKDLAKTIEGLNNQ